MLSVFLVLFSLDVPPTLYVLSLWCFISSLVFRLMAFVGICLCCCGWPFIAYDFIDYGDCFDVLGLNFALGNLELLALDFLLSLIELSAACS